MKDAYTAKEIAQAMGTTDRAVRKKADSDQWSFVEVAGGKGRPSKQYAFSTLPADIREALARVSTSAAASAGRRDSLKLKLDAEAKARDEKTAREQGLARFFCLGEKAKSRADAKLALLSACAEFIRAHGLGRKRGRELFAHQYNTGVIEVDAEIRDMIPKVCSNTLDNWKKQLSQCGLARLAGNYGKHLRGTGKIDSNPAIADLILALLEDNPDHTSSYILDGIKVRFPDVTMSARTVQKWLEKFKRFNPRRYQEMKDPDKARSLYQPADGNRYEGIERPNQRWEMDSTKGDVILNDNGTRTRHMIVGCIDIYTRRVKFLVSRSSNSSAVASLLRRCLLEWGQVEELGTDNGTDFVSNHICRIASSLHIHRDVAAPFTPEHKPYIERVFGTFLHGLLHGAAGYIGHSVAERKGIENRKSFAKRVVGAWRKGEELAPAELLMTPERLQEYCDDWTDNLYANRPHSGAGMNGKTPWQKAAEYAGKLSIITDERALDVLLSPVAGDGGWRTIRKKGLLVDRNSYTSAVLGGHEGKRVMVLQDETDWGAINVFLPDSEGELEFLCRAVCPEIAGVSRKEAAQARRRVYNAIRAEERAQARERTKRVLPRDVFREVMEHAVEKAGKLTRLPQPTIPHETEALRQAGIAARAQDAPVQQLTDAQQAKRRELAQEMAKPAVVHQLPETKRQRYQRWQRLDAEIQAGRDVKPEDRRWWESFQTTSEFRAQRELADMFGEAAGGA